MSNDIIYMCEGCHQVIDPDYCHCGSRMDGHTIGDGHGPISAGCVCGYEKTAPVDESADINRLLVDYATTMQNILPMFSLEVLAKMLGYLPEDLMIPKEPT